MANEELGALKDLGLPPTYRDRAISATAPAMQWWQSLSPVNKELTEAEAKAQALKSTKRIFGDLEAENIMDSLGILDFTPAGLVFAGQEAYREFDKAEKPIDYILPTVGLGLSGLEAYPLTKPLVTTATKPLLGFFKNLANKTSAIDKKTFGVLPNVPDKKTALSQINKATDVASDVGSINKKIYDSVFEDLQGKPIPVNDDGTITVYHRTNSSVNDILESDGFFSKENTPEIFVSNKPDGQAIGYGENLIELKIDQKDLKLNDVFSDEAHFTVPIEKANKALSQIDQKGNVAKVEPPTETKPGIIAFTGSGADFDEFNLEFINTGEGNQAFGYGFYFSDSKDIADFYRKSVGGQELTDIKVKGKSIKDLGLSQGAINTIEARVYQANLDSLFLKGDEDFFQKKLDKASKMSPQVRQSFQEIVDSGIKEKDLDLIFNEGKTYKVALEPKPEELLDYDLPLSEQSNEIKVKFINALENLQNKNLDASLLNEVKVAQQKSEAVINLNKKLDNFVDELPNEKAKKIYKELIDEVFKDIPYNVKEYDLFKEFEEVVPFNKYPDIDSNIVYDIKSDLKLARPKTIGEMLPTDKITSEALSKAGIKGIKYKAEQLSGKIDSKNTNFVIFDDKLIKIMEKYGIVGPVAVSATAAALREDDGST